MRGRELAKLRRLHKDISRVLRTMDDLFIDDPELESEVEVMKEKLNSAINDSRKLNIKVEKEFEKFRAERVIDQEKIDKKLVLDKEK